MLASDMMMLCDCSDVQVAAEAVPTKPRVARATAVETNFIVEGGGSEEDDENRGMRLPVAAGVGRRRRNIEPVGEVAAVALQMETAGRTEERRQTRAREGQESGP